MVWKLRSKTAFTYQNGHHRYLVPSFKTIPYENINELPYIAVKSDTYSQVRIIHNYRNTSRACKQFLLGDPVAEQLMLSALRVEYLWPVKNIKSPIENFLPIQRQLADHTDRHYSLIANNQHPMQLFFYEYLNKKYRKQQELIDYKEGKSAPSFEVALEEKVNELIEEKLQTKDFENGEDLSPEEIADIHKEANEEVRAKMNLIIKTRGKTGDVEDYLETRRPFRNEKELGERI